MNADGAVRSNWGEFRAGLRDGLPLTISIFSYGLAYGVLARQAGLTYGELITMSALVFAGSSQLAAVGMIKTAAGAAPIILTTLLLNLRHLLMGGSLAPVLEGVSTPRLFVLAHLINDESYALTMGRDPRLGPNPAYFAGAGVATLLGWLPSSAVAGAFGNLIGDPRRFALEFAFFGVFIGLLVPQLKGRAVWISFGAAAFAAVVASQLLPGKWYIIIAAFVAMAVGAVVETYADQHALPDHRNGRRNLSDAG